MANVVVWPGEYGVQAGHVTDQVQAGTLKSMAFVAQYANGATIDLTGKTLSATMRSAATGVETAVTGTLTPADGSFTWKPSAADVGTAGGFWLQVTYTDGVDNAPSFEVYFEIEAKHTVTAVARAALEGISSTLVAYLTALAASVPDAGNVLSAANNLSDLDDAATARTNLGVSSSLEIYGGIHVHDNSVAQSIPAGSTYTKITAYSDNDPSTGLTADAANDKITLATAGRYQVVGTFSFLAGTNNVTIYASLFVGGVEIDSVHFTRKIATGGDVGAATFSGIIDVGSVPVDVDVRMRHDSGGAVAVTIRYANLNMHYLGAAP